MTNHQKWQAVKNNDASKDGLFYYAVKTTGVFCRPSCKSRLPKREHVTFFDAADDAKSAGYRPCKRCRPDLQNYQPMQETARKMKRRIDDHYASSKRLDSELKQLGITQHRLKQIFKECYGCTVREYINQQRLIEAKRMLVHTTEKIVSIAYAVGFNSLSAFYRFFRQQTGSSPAKYRRDFKISKEESSNE